ncbi:hypothetical protein MKW98_015242 [Papaver atlanticum]|uniref:Uncharacterized protein n=1 Tax=Papaver atlanticum TaxID=357466 RepID=A0AAD4T348_9MAGN|nr:hypothetical protein MKW98_015242 [Papaver atlanticum]
MDSKAANTTGYDAAAAAIEGSEPQGQSTEASSSDSESYEEASSSDYESDEEDSAPDQKVSNSPDDEE